MFDDENELTPEELLDRELAQGGLWADPNVPKSGWDWCDPPTTDRGEPVHICEMCQWKRVRYVQHLVHARTGMRLDVGCVCAGAMTGNPDKAQKLEGTMVNRVRRNQRYSAEREKFHGHGGWRTERHMGKERDTYREGQVTIILGAAEGGKFCLKWRIGHDRWDDWEGIYDSVKEARRGAHDVLVYLCMRRVL